MSARPFRPFRWVAGGSIALIVTIWTALMLGLHAPSVRSVPVAPWAEGGFGADRPVETTAAVPAASQASPARVAGVRIPEPAAGGGTPSAPVVPLDSGRVSKPSSTPPVEIVWALPPASLPALSIPIVSAELLGATGE